MKNGRQRRSTATARGTAGHYAAGGASTLYGIRVREIWRYIWTQSASYWWICIYLFLEYVRPQQVYPAIDVLPVALSSIVLCLIFFVLEGSRLRPWYLADTLLVLFSGIILLSSMFAHSPRVSFDGLSLFFSWVLIYFLITNIVKDERRFLVFMLAYLLFCTKMSQHGVRSWAEAGFGFRSWGATCAPAWFHNSGECGIQMAMFFPVCMFFVLALKPYWGKVKTWLFAFMPASAAITIVASSSRGALLALGAIVLWMLAKSRKRVKALSGTAVLAAVVFAIIPPEQKERLNAMGDDDTSTSRITYWEHGIEILQANPVLGIGYDNWLPYYRKYYDPGGQLPHNIFIEAGAELGYLGLGGFLLLIVCTFVLNHRTRKVASRLPDGGRFPSCMAHGLDGALVGYLVSGFFVTVLYYPFFWINLAMTVALHNATRNTPRRAGVGPVRPPARVRGRGAPLRRGARLQPQVDHGA